MKSAKAPDPPDPTKTIAAQTASNKETSGYQQSMNMIDQNTPLGSLRYTNVGTDPTTGAPKYQSDVSLTPSGQRSFDLQQQVGEALNNLALKGSGQVSTAFDQPQNYNNLPAIDIDSLPGIKSFDSSKFAAPTASEEDYKQAQDALRNQFKSRLDPQWADDEKALDTKLTNQGLHQNDEAWNKAKESFTRGRTDAYQTADNNAITGATAIQQGQFNMKQQSYADQIAAALKDYDTSVADRSRTLGERTSARQQGITEANYLRELPINEISSLLNGGQVSTPSFSNTPQTQVQGTDVAGIIQNDFSNRNSIYQTQQASNNAAFGAIAGLAGSALGGWATGGFKV